jgi:two-component system phosphate regulon sensor histidine kinase PhoR
VDLHGQVLHFNAAAARLLLLDEPQSRGRVLAEMVRQPELMKFIRDIQAAGQAAETAMQLPGERFVRLHGTPLEDAAGRNIGVLVVLSDTTRLQRLEKMRQDFVANVSHELKTPITALRGGVETLLDSNRSEEDRHFIQMMGRQVERLGAIVNDLLSLSRLEHDEQNNRVPLERGPIRDVLRRAAGNFARAAETKRVTVTVDCPEGLAAPINAALLEQAVGNLIDNAIKYSGPGTRVGVSADTVNGNGLAIRVQDNGPGIEQRHLPRIFERFYRVDQARSRALGGTGLGLAIVKHIAQAHGGMVAVESTPGTGSVFTIRLPRK